MSVGGENWDVWTPDSGRVVLGSTRETLRGLFQTPFDGTGEVERLMTLSEDGALPIDQGPLTVQGDVPEGTVINSRVSCQ